MSHDHAWNQHNGRSTGRRNWLEIILLILVGLMIVLLAYQGITHRSKGHTIAFGHIGTSGDLTKMLFSNR